MFRLHVDERAAFAPAVATSVTTVSATASGAPTGPASGAVSAVEGVRAAAPQKSTAPPKGGPRASESPVTEQVARGLTGLLSGKGGRVTLKLSPAELGHVRVQVEVRDGVVTARFEASDASARDLLSQQMDTLRAAIETRGMRVERLEVDERLLPASPEATERDGPRGAREHGQATSNAEDRDRAWSGASEDGPDERRDGPAGEPWSREGAAHGRAGQRPARDAGGAGTNTDHMTEPSADAEASGLVTERIVRLGVDVVA